MKNLRLKVNSLQSFFQGHNRKQNDYQRANNLKLTQISCAFHLNGNKMEKQNPGTSVIQPWPRRHKNGIDLLLGETMEQSNFQKKSQTSHTVRCAGMDDCLQSDKQNRRRISLFLSLLVISVQIVPSEFVPSRQRYERAVQEIKEAVGVASQLKLWVQSSAVGKKAELAGLRELRPFSCHWVQRYAPSGVIHALATLSHAYSPSNYHPIIYQGNYGYTGKSR